MDTQDAYSTRHVRRLLAALTLSLTLALIVAGVFMMLTLTRFSLPATYSAIVTQTTLYGQVFSNHGLLIYLSVTMVLLAAAAVLGTLYTHRIDGPLLRVRARARAIAGGDLGGELRLRKEDDIAPLSQSLNDFTGRYRLRYDVLQRKVDLLRADALELQAAVDAKEEVGVELAIAALAGHSGEIRALFEELRL